MSYSATSSVEGSHLDARGTTLMQWKAYEACFEQKLSQVQAAALFGVSQSAISRRLQRYLERSGRRVHRGRRRVARPASLSTVGNI